MSLPVVKLSISGARGENILDVVRRLGLDGCAANAADSVAMSHLAQYLVDNFDGTDLAATLAAAAIAQTYGSIWTTPFGTIAASAPGSPSDGDKYINTTDKKGYIRSSGAWVGYTPLEGQKAVVGPRNYQFIDGDWRADTLTVTLEQFGADGDGTTDDTAAILAAIAFLNPNAAGDLSPSATEADARLYGGTILLDKRKYRFTQPIFHPGILIRGTGTRRMFGYDYTSNDMDTLPGSVLYYDPADPDDAALCSHGWVSTTGAVIPADGSLEIANGTEVIDGIYVTPAGGGLENVTLFTDDADARLGISMQGAMLSTFRDILLIGFKSGIRSRSSWQVEGGLIQTVGCSVEHAHFFDTATRFSNFHGWLHSNGNDGRGLVLGYTTGKFDFQIEQCDVAIALKSICNVDLSACVFDKIADDCILVEEGNTRFTFDCAIPTMEALSTTNFLNAVDPNLEIYGIIANLYAPNLDRVLGPNITGANCRLKLDMVAPCPSDDLAAIDEATPLEWWVTPNLRLYPGNGTISRDEKLPDTASALRRNYLFDEDGKFYILVDQNCFALHDYDSGNVRVRFNAGDASLTIGSGKFQFGSGNPEGAVLGTTGDLFASSTGFFRKASGTNTDTGWTAATFT